MKKRYQIDTQRAVQAFRQMAAQTDNSIHLVIPLKEVVDLIQRGLMNLALSPFTKVAGQVMDYEVTALVGPKIRPKPNAHTCAGAARLLRGGRTEDPVGPAAGARYAARGSAVGQLRVAPARLALLAL
ncbi:MAG TPA: hypothetical protein VKV17_14030 [Bryobacteraceae bacterium]|nr:hypothetical protein [Bryobacteraceae bacterium]